MTTQSTQPENNDTQTTVVEDSSVPTTPSNDGIAEVPATAQTQDTLISLFTPEAPAPSFTDLIEEFRQREERMAQSGTEPAIEQATETRETNTQTEHAQTAEVQEAGTLNRVPTGEGHEQVEGTEQGTSNTPETTPSTRPQRLVPPPLRPATRIRMPRHGSTRQRETFVTQASTPTASAEPGVPAPVEEASAAAQALHTSPESPAPTEEVTEQNATGTTPDVQAQETQVEQAEPPKPARRYRFDRREPATHSVSPSKPLSLAPSPAEPAGARARQENLVSEQSTKPINGSTLEVQTPVSVSEPAPAPESDVVTPSAQASHSHNDRRRRHGHEGQQPKAQVSLESVKDIVKAETTRPGDAVNRVPGETSAEDQPVPQPASQPAPQPVTDTQSETPQLAPTEIPLEDLPPLEYSELQAASRRRRRHRAGNNGAAAKPAPAAQASASALSPTGPAPVAPVSPVTPPRTQGTQVTPYTIQSGMTVNQMNQGNDLAGPFQGPEPTPARGSVLPTQPRLSSSRSIRNGSEAQRGSVAPLPTARSGGNDGVLSTAAVNHLANVISQAIQTQSDRMVAELRRTNQAAANVSVTLPPFPSTERVGVFVDVANLLYSARTLRTAIDFGKLLDFLRGNRRLVRAHAYCPTSPQPGDDQMFLQAVKGLGYRITTKNYKTFASGAKKADMDLDLCMDVVRLVDGKAVDTIVLVSGDSDFMPLLDYCSDHGVRVEVVAFDESMSATLRQSCDLFINLSMLDEIRVS